MKLNYQEEMNILRTFPSIELSYEKKIHKKVPHHNIVLTIPKGKKYFAWFRVYKKRNVCFLLELDKYKKNIKSITIQRCCFTNELCIQQGTILYGTKFSHHNTNFFNIEDIFFYKNKSIVAFSQIEKWKKINELISISLKQVIYSHYEMIFGLPLIAKTRKALLEKKDTIPYPMYCIQYRTLYKNTPFFNEVIHIAKETKRIFMVKATLVDDIYDLYYKSAPNKYELYTSAFISNVKTSVWMNSLFRNIKENKNLDALEESDDEEEFENISKDKYVDLTKEMKINCVYLSLFKAWAPETLCLEGEVCYKKDIISL
jgi:hypothetical protein